MSTASDTVRSNASLTSLILKTYIHDGLLIQQAMSEGYKVLPIVRFVSYTDRILRLLVGGRCPSCNVLHLRDTCNIRFCKEVVLPILKKRFPSIAAVVPVLIHSSDFDQIVNDNGLNVITPCDKSQRQSFYDQQKLMLDQHPLVDGLIKFFALKSKFDEPFTFTDCPSRTQMVRKYKSCWKVDNQTRVSNDHGDVFVGAIEIITNSDKLPEHLSLHYLPSIDDNVIPALVAESIQFFDTSEYEVLIE